MVGVQDALPLTYASCVHNMVNALEQRMFKATAPLRLPNGRPTPTLLAWRAVRRHTLRSEKPAPRIRPMSQRAWIKRFPPARAAAITDACARVNGDVERVRQSYDLFPKLEHVAKLCYRAVKKGKARCIMGPNLVWLARLGPWFVSYGDHLKEKWSAQAQVYYTAGANSQDLGRWFTAALKDIGDRYGSVGIFEDDFTEFDGSQGPCARWYLSARYADHGAPKVVLRYATAAMMRGGSRRGLRMRATAKRSSGDPDTSCGNTTLNADTHRYLLDAVCDDLGYPRDCWRMAVLGDDMICVGPLAVVNEACRRAPAYFLELGLVAKPKVTTRPLAAEYCSGRFYQVARGGRVWGPKPGRWLAKSSWRLAGDFDIPDNEWVAAVRSGLYVDASHVPILRLLGRPGPRVIRGNRPPSTGRETPSDAAMEELCELYRIAPADLQELEQAVADTPFGGFVAHPLLDRILRADLEMEAGHPANNENWLLAEGYDLLWPVSAPACAAQPDRWGSY